MPKSLSRVFRDVTRKPFHDDRAAIRLLNRKTDEGDCLFVSIPIARLNATQSTVNDDFREAPRRYADDDSVALPAVVKFHGRYYVTDGHHRIMAAADIGEITIAVRLFDLDDDTQTDFPLLSWGVGAAEPIRIPTSDSDDTPYPAPT